MVGKILKIPGGEPGRLQRYRGFRGRFPFREVRFPGFPEAGSRRLTAGRNAKKFPEPVALGIFPA
jgi:hypothetical protein